MDHNEALQSNACEKYLLGELAPDLRDAYELHYFSCAECASQLRSAADFLTASRQILAESPVSVPHTKFQHASGEWQPRRSFAWFRPAIAIPVFAVLLLFIGYQNLVLIPSYKQASTPQVLPMYSLISANTLGDEDHHIPAHPGQPFGLYVDAPYDPAYSVYLLTLQSPAGASTHLRSLSAAEAQKTQVITVNPGSQAGQYTLIISGLANPAADPSSAKELARLQFSVAF